MEYHGKGVWVEEAERRNRKIAHLSRRKRRLYLQGYHDATKFWLDLETKGYIDVHIGKRRSSLFDELDNSD